MSSVVKSPREVKRGRTIRVSVRPTDVNPVRVVVIRDGSRVDHYTLSPLPTDCVQIPPMERTVCVPVLFMGGWSGPMIASDS